MAMNENMENMKGFDILDVLLDGDNHEDIVLMDENGIPMSFEQVATIPLMVQGHPRLFCVLKPLDEIEGIEDDEAAVFAVEIDDDGNGCIKLEEDEGVANTVFDKYLELLKNARSSRTEKR